MIRKVTLVIKQNLFIAVGVVIVLIIAGALSLTNIIVAVAVHEGLTLLVIFNALRLVTRRDKLTTLQD